MHTLADVFADHAVNGPNEAARGNQSAGACPHDAFPSRGQDQWCAIVCETDDQWRALAAIIGDDLGADPRFSELAGRKANEEALNAILSAWTRGQDKHVLAAALRGAGIPAGAVQDGRDVFTDPELIATGHYVRVDHKVMGASDMPAPPMQFSRSEIVIGPAPCLGEHNQQVLVDWLGMAPAEVAALEAEGALA